MLSSIIFYKKKGKTEYVGSNEVPKVTFFFWINKEEYIYIYIRGATRNTKSLSNLHKS